VTVGIVIVLQVAVCNYWPHFESPSERARAYQAVAVVARGSLAIGPEVRRFGGMEDLASVGGALFPNKAPGMLPLLLPGAFVARVLTDRPEAELRWTMVLDRLVAASLPFVVCVLLLARVTVTRFPRGGPLAVTAYALATPALAASLVLFSHALTGCLLLAGFLLLFRSPQPHWKVALLAGLLLAWASVCEYPVALPGLVLGVLAVRRLRTRGSFALLAGAALPVLLLAAYNLACFGSPFALSVGHESYRSFAALEEQGVFGVSWPTASGFVGLLASPSRGLLVWAPVSLVAVVGAMRGRRSQEDRAARIALVTAPLLLLLAMSGYPNWHGGWFAGPRYLLPVLPLVFVLVAMGAESALQRPWGTVVLALGALWGWAQLWPVVATFPFPPPDFPLPAFTLAPRLAAAGVHAPSWLPGALLLPLLVVLALGAGVQLLVLATPGGRWGNRLAAVALLVGAVLLASQLRPPAAWQGSLEYAVIHDVYTDGPKGALEALAPRADTQARRAKLEAWIARRDGASR
jgi:hypothetical protein